MSALPEILAWDCEGVPMFDDDELDVRYQAFIDRLRERDNEKGGRAWFDVDCAFSELTYSDADLSLSEEGLHLLDELIKRAWLRRRAVEVALGLVAEEAGK